MSYNERQETEFSLTTCGLVSQVQTPDAALRKAFWPTGGGKKVLICIASANATHLGFKNQSLHNAELAQYPEAFGICLMPASPCTTGRMQR